MDSTAPIQTSLSWHDLPMASDFWDRITEAFGDAGYGTSQNAIARELHMTQGAVAKWSRGVGYPTLRKCLEIARLTGVSIEWLLMGPPAEKKQHEMDDKTRQLLEAWSALPAQAKNELISFAQFRAQSQDRKDAPADVVRSDQVKTRN